MPPSRAQLDRWVFYANYVRALTVNGMAGRDRDKVYHPGSFLKLAHITERPVLPNLKTLVAYGSWVQTWDSSAPSIFATILSESVLRLDIDHLHYSDARGILEIIRQQAPKLRFLRLFFLSSPNPRCDMLCKFLPSLCFLQILRLHPGCASDDLFASIGPNLPHLQILDFQLDPEDEIYDKAYVLGLQPFNKPNQGMGAEFPSLKSLLLEWGPTICCSLGDTITKKFGHKHPLRILSTSVAHKPGESLCPNNDGIEIECIPHYCKALGPVFPFLESFHLNSHTDFDPIPTLKMELVQSLLICTHLKELSLIGFDVADNLELSNFLACWPNLVKLEIVGPELLSLWHTYGNEIDEEIMWDFVNNEIAEGGILVLEGARGISLECLTMIKDHLPRLKQLKITLVVCATEHLQQALQPFDDLEKLEFTHSFWNFRQPDFDHRKAARFISSFMNSTTEFVFREDFSLKHYLCDSELREMQDRDEETDRPWTVYSKDYNKFCEPFQEKVVLARDARLDERQRILQPYNTASQS
jgi:hypothetical protein